MHPAVLTCSWRHFHIVNGTEVSLDCSCLRLSKHVSRHCRGHCLGRRHVVMELSIRSLASAPRDPRECKEEKKKVKKKKKANREPKVKSRKRRRRRRRSSSDEEPVPTRDEQMPRTTAREQQVPETTAASSSSTRPEDQGRWVFQAFWEPAKLGATPSKPSSGKAAAKMLVRAGLRCRCHFALHCPDLLDDRRGTQHLHSPSVMYSPGLAEGELICIEFSLRVCSLICAA